MSSLAAASGHYFTLSLPVGCFLCSLDRRDGSQLTWSVNPVNEGMM